MTIRFLATGLALASLMSPTIAAAQVADRAGAPSGTAPLQAPCVVQANNTCAAVKDSVPMPVIITSRPTGTSAAQVQGTNPNGQPDIGNPVTVAGSDGTNTRTVRTGTDGVLYVSERGSPNVQGTAVSGAADSGSPVKIGARYNATLPTFTDAQRADAQIDNRGNLRVVIVGQEAGGTDAVANSFAFIKQAGSQGAAALLPVAPLLYNGTTWDRPRGDTNGAFSQGNVASGSTDTGNPVKIGGVVGAGSLPSMTIANRTDAIFDNYGNQRTRLVGSTLTTPVATGTQVVGAAPINLNQINSVAPLMTMNYVWSGTNTIPAPGDQTGAYIVPKGGPSVATSQTSVGTTAVLVIPARAGRNKVTVTIGAANTCALGNAGVTLTTGFPLQPVAGASITLDTAAAIYAVCNATTTVSDIETF